MPSLQSLMALIPSNPTAAAGPVEADDTPDVDDSGAGVAHIDAEPYPVVGPVSSSAPAPPAVTIDNPALPGAPSHVELSAPTRDLGVSTYTLPNNTSGLRPLAVVPGSSQRRRVTISVHQLDAADDIAVYLAPDNRQNTTGARLLPGQPYELRTGSPLFAVNDGANTAQLSVIIEPIA